MEDIANNALLQGAHLTTPRWGYVHHGIYAGDGRVIHYAGFNRLFHRGPVEEVSLGQFTRGRRLAVHPCVTPTYTGLAVVIRARSRLNENRYRLWSNNCEHFAEWCISGTSRSAQIDCWRTRIARLLAVSGASWIMRAFHPKYPQSESKSAGNLITAQCEA